MPKKLNFVYEWLTPEGALPNVPGFTDPKKLMEGCQIIGLGDSTLRSGFVNKTDPYIDFNNQYSLYSACKLPNAPFIYDINFTLQQYTNLKTKTFDVEHGIFNDILLRDSILQRVKSKYAYLLFRTDVESIVEENLFERMHRYFKHYDIPLTQIIYMNNCVNGADLYKEYCLANGIENGMHIEYMPILRMRRSYLKELLETNAGPYTPGPRAKDFLCFNRIYHRHRLIFLTELSKRNLIKNFYISMPNPGNWDRQPPNGTFKEYMDQAVIKAGYNVFNHTESDIDLTQAQLPLVIDTPDFSRLPMESNANDLTKFYQNSLVHITAESYFFERKIHLTEKTYKPIAYKQPFIMLSSPGSLKHLKDLGFKTFSDFWDESYDACLDHDERFKMILNIVETIANWSPEKKLQFTHDVEPIINFNFNYLNIFENVEATSFVEKYGSDDNEVMPIVF
jgi:hypothetical protein